MSLTREASSSIRVTGVDSPSTISGANGGSFPKVMKAVTPDELKDVYRLVEPEMNGVGDVILKSLRHWNPAVDEILRYSMKLGGKRLRPLLVLLCARACGSVRREHRLAAAALEMIHTGTLIHDDILDGAQFRRHLETVNLRWDSQYAVLVGDLLLTKAMSLVTECRNQAAYDVIADACRRTCEGELLQVSSRSRFDMTRADYMKIIEGKTASLLEASCRLGASFTDQTPETLDLLARFGRLLGLAFQIFDDILDLIGDQNEMGKTLGTDLLNQKPTLPLIHYLETVEKREKDAILALLNRPNFEETDSAEVVSRLEANGSIQVARQTATDFVQEAISLIACLPAADSVGSDIDSAAQTEARHALEKVARFIVARNL